MPFLENHGVQKNGRFCELLKIKLGCGMLDFFNRWVNDFVDQLNQPLARARQSRVGINPHTAQRSIFAPILVDLDQEINAIEASTLLLSTALSKFIESRRQVKETNEGLSQQYNSLEYKLMCPLLQGFPLIPVRFNGRLYDYDQLVRLIKDDTIIDPFTREKIKLSPHIIQPDYDAQERMDILLNEMKKNQQRTTMTN
ncbi:MAG: hypothetical protein A3F13_03990 [Gammaproteobacteria bacterium RIFCSPHIGHO2_12_FULL_40_19]|nr:MAG: hypothetical protein A3F13_03990 [Gammaproteobacteria bacterium RIFCSPHIGHO2_12_FULL_40_19]HLB41980.1 hypothetical protein [Gammaproteobacteria bacterium]